MVPLVSRPKKKKNDPGRGSAIPPLLPVPTNLVSPGDRLCDTCKALELTPTRFVVLPGDPDAGENQPDSLDLPLGLVTDMLEKNFCPFCRLAMVALGGKKVPAFQDGEPTCVVMSWNTDGPKPDPHAPWNHEPQIRILRPYCQTASGGFLGSVMLNMFPEITLLANDSPVPATTFFARPILEEKIDFSMVQNWLSLCESWHGNECDKSEMLEIDADDPADKIPAFRLIDVVDNCIMRAESGTKYATLSYVWGRLEFLRSLKGNISELEKPGALKLPEFYDKIPWTIRDAIQTVREVGLRYLWVDSLCIVQDDDTGQHAEAISKMDLVYGAAYITIIASTGDSADAGLPGVRPGTRNYHQPIEELMPGLRLAFKPRSVDYIEGSVYPTRGWTFQEKLFSRRVLQFIGGQVVFSCRRASEWREDIVFEDETGISGDISMPNEKDDIGEFEGLIQTYSDLRLTYDFDIYNAFAGIATYIAREMDSHLCHGIPEAYFDWFLLWTPLKSQTRRQIAPSWSWSGWVGGSYPRIWDWYTRNMKKIRKAQRHRTWIIWYQRVAHDSQECRPVWTHSNSSAAGQRNFYGGPVKHRFNFDCSKTIPTPRKLVEVPKYIKDTLSPHPGSGFLQFWTVSVTFRLDTPTSTESENNPVNTDSRVGIFGKSGRELGTTLVADSWKLDHVPGEHEFILLCEGRDERAERGREDNEDGWKYKVMLLEWHGAWAERVSLGSIEKGDLFEALGEGPVWKEIILG